MSFHNKRMINFLLRNLCYSWVHFWDRQVSSFLWRDAKNAKKHYLCTNSSELNYLKGIFNYGLHLGSIFDYHHHQQQHPQHYYDSSLQVKSQVISIHPTLWCLLLLYNMDFFHVLMVFAMRGCYLAIGSLDVVKTQKQQKIVNLFKF